MPRDAPLTCGVTKESKCDHGYDIISCRNYYCLQANFKRLLVVCASLPTSVLANSRCGTHGDYMAACADANCLQKNMCKLLDEIGKITTGSTTSLDSVLKPGLQFMVANDLEVSRCSSITSVDLLRRHQPDATRWANLVGLKIEVDEDDFRAIVRSALSGRACVLNDALGAKAAEKFAATQDVSGPGTSPTFGAQTASATPHGGSEKSFDMFD